MSQNAEVSVKMEPRKFIYEMIGDDILFTLNGVEYSKPYNQFIQWLVDVKGQGFGFRKFLDAAIQTNNILFKEASTQTTQHKYKNAKVDRSCDENIIVDSDAVFGVNEAIALEQDCATLDNFNKINTAIDSPTNKGKKILTKNKRSNAKNQKLNSDEEKCYSCKQCAKSYKKKIHLTEHERIHSGIKPYSCKVCLKSFTRYWYLSNHVAIHTGVKAHACEVCGQTFTQSGSLVKHRKIHTDYKSLACDLCNKKFTWVSSLNKHKLAHNREETFCLNCNQSYSEICDIHNHKLVFKENHDGFPKPRMFNKRKCKKKGVSVSHVCSVCNKVLCSSSKLEEHSRIHSGEKPWICEECGKVFSRANHLKEHQRGHSGYKPFLCDKCSKAFTRKWYLTAHKRKCGQNR